jgi:putative ABC transport system permease protein
VVVISEALWRSRYGSDPALLGRSIRLNGETHLLVGIAAPSLLFPTGTLLHSVLPFAPRIDVWKPLAPTKSELEGESWDRGLLARLKPGESAERGRQQLQTMLNRSIRTQVPDLKTDLIVQLVPIREIYAGRVRLRLLLVSRLLHFCS